jgi:prolyl oligopeptidase
VVDDYRWLENGNSLGVRRWTAAQDRRARAFLDALADRKPFGQRLEEISKIGFSFYRSFRFAGGRLFGLKYDSRHDRPRLVVFDSVQNLARERVLFDTAKLAPPDRVANFDLFVPSWDGRYLAACISEGGSEEGDMQLFEASSGKPLADVIPRAHRVGGGAAAWTADGRGFFYVRHPAPGERPPEDLDFYQQVFFHRLGTPYKDDAYALGREFPRIAEVTLDSVPNQDLCLVTVAHGDGGQFEHWIGDGRHPWVRVSEPRDAVFHAALAPDGNLYVVSRKETPRGRVLRVKPPKWSLAEAEQVLPDREWIVEEVVPTPGYLYLREQLGGLGRLDRVRLRTGEVEEVPLPSNSALGQLIALEGDSILYGVSTYLSPPSYFVLNGSEPPTRTPFSSSSPVDLSGFEVARDFATSKDGTRVPISIIAPLGLPRDGSRPLLLTGYGGYGISFSPTFAVWWIPWLEAGGLLAFSNLRGGGEFGESWHQAGMLTKKQNVFDDFIACAEHLCRRGFTSKERLGIFGGSNGGLLMGAVLTQRPDLARAVVADVGVFDSLVSELEPNGQFNVTEFGTVKDPDQFRALYAYSPFHHVKDGTAYGAVLLCTGENDRRVNPLQSRKMTARLQAAISSDEPILLRTSGNWGHGPSSFGELIGLFADQLAFFSDRLGLVRLPKGRPKDAGTKRR